MKITVVTNTSWNIFNFRLPLLRFLESQGHQVIVLAPEDEYSNNLKQEFNHFESIKVSRKGKNPIKDLFFFVELLKIYKKVKPDLCLHYTIKPNIYGALAARRLKIPHINNVTGLGTVFLHDNFSSKIAKKLYRIAFRKGGITFFQNQSDKQLFIEQGLCSEKLSDLIPGSGINTKVFEQIKKDTSGILNFAFVGRMLFDKGILELIEGIRKFKNAGHKANFIFVGKVETESGLGVNEDKIKEWEDENLIKYEGLISDMKKFLEKIDCVILPSYREGTPRALLEAASMSLPLIATNVPGCREVVVDGLNGFLCEPKNADSIFEALKKMLSLPLDKRILMGKEGRKRVISLFSEEIVLTKYNQVISELVKK